MGALALSGGCGCSHAEESWLLSVPPFAIEVDAAKVQFERAPEEIYQCESLSERRGLVFVIAKVRIREADYYLLGGWVETETDSPGSPTYESQINEGTLAAISEQGCREVGLDYALSTGERERRLVKEQGFSDQVIESLIDDAIERQIRIFGGRDNFVCLPDIAGSSGWDPLLRKKLEQLGKPSKPCK
jgi:hypothetical protein